MADKEKIIRGLFHCKKHDGKDCPDCPYFNVECIDDLCADALDLIKELLKEMNEQKITWNEMIHPDMKAIEKRDAFLSDENGKKLREMIDQIHLMEDILSDN